MASNRAKTNLVHVSKKETFDVSREKATGKLFIKNTDTEVRSDRVSRKGNEGHHSFGNSSNQSFDDEEDDEWSDFAWTGDDC